MAQQQVGAFGRFGIGAHQKVGGLHVLVDDLVIVGVLKRIGGLADQMGQRVRRQSCPGACWPIQSTSEPSGR